MTLSTHITFAEFVYLLLLTTAGVTLNIFNAVTIAIGSMLPDIDTSASLIGRTIPFISTPIERRFGHRTLTHSAIFIVALSIILLPAIFLSRDTYLCVLVGYASHPFLDTMTIHGVKLFYPFSPVKCVFPLEVNRPHSYRMQTGSKMDRALTIFFLIGCIPTFFIAHQGYERFIRLTQQNIEAAVRDYNEFSKDHVVLADVKSYDMLTKQRFEGRVSIIGALNDHTLLFKGPDGRIHTLGKEFDADYVAEAITCLPGRLAQFSITYHNLSNQYLSSIASQIDTSYENYFFGDLSTHDKVSLPQNLNNFNPISGNGSSIKFNYATYADIRNSDIESVFISEGTLTVKSVVPNNLNDSGLSITPAQAFSDNYSRMSIVIDPKDSIIILKNKSDTLRENEVIAKKCLAHFFYNQIDLNNEKINALQQQNNELLMSINRRIFEAQQLFQMDSLEYSNDSVLSGHGFIPEKNLQLLRLKLLKESRTLEQLLALRSKTLSNGVLDIRKLNLSNEQLQSRARAADMESGIRSTVSGVLIDIRQSYHNNKIQLTFIVKRIK